MRKRELIKRINEFYEYLHMMSHHKEIDITLRKFYDLFKSVLNWDWDLKTEDTNETHKNRITSEKQRGNA